MESQSVVTHLISQVKIGMDLTKVVLPTFILERRSLLEMYADYFAHPDIFLKATELQTERERMVQIVKWYLASFHAGRKSAVAKKPYNPILGEIFRCHWDLPDTSSDDEVVADGPVPWCHRNQLTFIAEQVSHHPPISAFYAEHVNKRVSLCAHVWTKSKFLGLSGGVHRSRSRKKDSTKPFYGGKKHRITAEVFARNEKKPFLTVSGEWNGAMEAKWADGRTETFIDVSKLPISKKIVRKIDEQEENESRSIWKEVTLGLK
ncbi:oxysterol-binding protein-related protein 9-like [Diaphorina citri]|uniref:Oxysterol-binding protein n=1 Tax=Diaphorina citri TaxID=121845 RepID=A0A1S3D9J9_DIACI|nr:oxysterol-binding protein-related protein 9-like [Diaphorina citri]